MQSYEESLCICRNIVGVLTLNNILRLRHYCCNDDWTLLSVIRVLLF